MAIRLPIVLSQSEPTDNIGPSDDLILTHLFMERGWDATLLGKLDQIESGSTDDLCLSSISGPFVLLCRHDVDSITRQLDRLLVSGRLYQPLLGSEPISIGLSTRSIYFFQITTNEAFETSLQSIRRIQESLGKQIFTIQLGNNLAASSPKESPSAATVHGTPTENLAEPKKAILSQVSDLSSKAIATSTRLPNISNAAMLNSQEEAGLDLLLDQLDQADV